MSLKARLAVILLVTVSLVTTTSGAEETPIKPVPPTVFRPVVIPDITSPVRVPVTKVEDPISTPTPSKAPVKQPKPKPKVETKVKLKVPALSGRIRKGVASWYCVRGVSRCTRGFPDGRGSYYAAIRKDLLFLRGRRIQVCSNRCLWVRIIDCNCGRNANLIDLYGDSFKYFYPLSKGRFNVTIRW